MVIGVKKKLNCMPFLSFPNISMSPELASVSLEFSQDFWLIWGIWVIYWGSVVKKDFLNYSVPPRIPVTQFSFSILFLLCFFGGIFQRIWADEVFLSLACSDIFSLPNALGTLPMLKKNRCCWFWRAIGRAGLASKVFRCFWWGCSWAALCRRLDQCYRCYLEVLVDFRKGKRFWWEFWRFDWLRIWKLVLWCYHWCML